MTDRASTSTVDESVAPRGGDWLVEFHAGDREVLEQCYREYFDTVDLAVSKVLGGADRETVVHEVFYRLVSRRAMRERFTGGSLAAWLTVVARNLARDHARRCRREEAVDPAVMETLTSSSDPLQVEGRLEAHRLVTRFRQEVLPPKWAPVFEMRFLRQLSQREAAAELGMRRTTLAYQELRIRRLLCRYLLEGDEP